MGSSSIDPDEDVDEAVLSDLGDGDGDGDGNGNGNGNGNRARFQRSR
jgi:hypothetical protein